MADKKGGNVDFATWILIGLAAVMAILAYRQGRVTFVDGLQETWGAFLNLAPLLVAVIVVVGFAEVLVPRELIANLMGRESGMRGILIASGLGALTPGGPFVSFPLVATLYKAGAGIGPVVAFVTSWSLLAFSRLPLEVAVVGLKVTAIRLASTLIFPPVAGLIAKYVFG